MREPLRDCWNLQLCGSCCSTVLNFAARPVCLNPIVWSACLLIHLVESHQSISLHPSTCLPPHLECFQPGMHSAASILTRFCETIGLSARCMRCEKPNHCGCGRASLSHFLSFAPLQLFLHHAACATLVCRGLGHSPSHH